MSGLEACARLRGGGHALPIVALTGNALKADRASCLAAGFTDVLPKPYSRDQLCAIIRKLCPAALAAAPPPQLSPTAAASSQLAPTAIDARPHSGSSHVRESLPALTPTRAATPLSSSVTPPSSSFPSSSFPHLRP